jgi:TolB-like protein
MFDSNRKVLNSYSEGDWLAGSWRIDAPLAHGSGAYPRREDGVLESEIRDEVVRILESSMFVQSERLGQFLRFTVETTLQGKAETLKEYVVGTQVYGRKPSYNPTEDSIVRSEARRLRRKLQEFYETIGKDDLVLIHYRPGSYVPVFRACDADRKPPAIAARTGGAFTQRPELRVAVLPFVGLSKDVLSSAYAQYVTDDLIHQLVRTDGVRVITGYSERPDGVETVDIPSLAKKLDVQIVFEGTVAVDNSQLRVTSSVVNSDGLRICSERFETNWDSQPLLNTSARIASALISRVCPEQPLAGKLNYSAGASTSAIHPLMLRAEGLLDEGTLAGTHAALAKWHEALEIEPRCVRAICGIAQSHCEMALRGIADSSIAVSHAHQAAERAVQLDPDMILAPACMGAVFTLSWNWREAEVKLQTGAWSRRECWNLSSVCHAARCAGPLAGSLELHPKSSADRSVFVPSKSSFDKTALPVPKLRARITVCVGATLVWTFAE